MPIQGVSFTNEQFGCSIQANGRTKRTQMYHVVGRTSIAYMVRFRLIHMPIGLVFLTGPGFMLTINYCTCQPSATSITNALRKCRDVLQCILRRTNNVFVLGHPNGQLIQRARDLKVVRCPTFVKQGRSIPNACSTVRGRQRNLTFPALAKNGVIHIDGVVHAVSPFHLPLNVRNVSGAPKGHKVHFRFNSIRSIFHGATNVSFRREHISVSFRHLTREVRQLIIGANGTHRVSTSVRPLIKLVYPFRQNSFFQCIYQCNAKYCHTIELINLSLPIIITMLRTNSRPRQNMINRLRDHATM